MYKVEFQIAPYIRLVKIKNEFQIEIDTDRGDLETLRFPISEEKLGAMISFIDIHKSREVLFALANSEDLKKYHGLFSKQLDQACIKRKISTGLRNYLNISVMKLGHWRKGHCLPTDEFAVKICQYFNWDIISTLKNIRLERAAKAINAKKRPDINTPNIKNKQLNAITDVIIAKTSNESSFAQ